MADDEITVDPQNSDGEKLSFGSNIEVYEEDGTGNLILENTNTGTKITLSSNAETGTLNATTEIQIGGNTAISSVAASGQVTLSSGAAVVDTGLSATNATFNLALGVDDPDADTKITGRLFWDDSAGTYKVEFVEDSTSVGNPTVNYDIIRVR